MWTEAGLEPHWIIQKIEEKEIRNGNDLMHYIAEYQNKTIHVVALRNNTTKVFRVKLSIKL
ncbi:MAG: hypothetical protein LBN11_01070 [Tannerella sp.]|jgi:S1-C subfamily serine protease|nr:hypothetical protein [Tannerella sp.]